MVVNAAASTLMRVPPGIIRPGLERLEMMIFFARRGDYGPTDDPARIGAQAERGLRARRGHFAERASCPMADTCARTGVGCPTARSLVTYREVDGPAEMNT